VIKLVHFCGYFRKISCRFGVVFVLFGLPKSNFAVCSELLDFPNPSEIVIFGLVLIFFENACFYFPLIFLFNSGNSNYTFF